MNPTPSGIYTIVYCSRNLIHGGPAEVRQGLHDILAASRRNNARRGITGALLYNAGSFAQVLEGPLDAVERVFETIQRDPRHSEVTIIRSEYLDERQFPEWSMAFAGGSSFAGSPEATDAFEAVFAGVADGGGQMLTLLRDLMCDEAEWLLLDNAAA